MRFRYLPTFKKQFKRLPVKLQNQFHQRVRLFVEDPASDILRVHPLKGKYAGYWSMNVSGDLRALFIKRGDEVIVFALIGTHSRLYG